MSAFLRPSTRSPVMARDHESARHATIIAPRWGRARKPSPGSSSAACPSQTPSGGQAARHLAGQLIDCDGLRRWDAGRGDHASCAFGLRIRGHGADSRALSAGLPRTASDSTSTPPSAPCEPALERASRCRWNPRWVAPSAATWVGGCRRPRADRAMMPASSTRTIQPGSRDARAACPETPSPSRSHRRCGPSRKASSTRCSPIGKPGYSASPSSPDSPPTTRPGASTRDRRRLRSGSADSLTL